MSIFCNMDWNLKSHRNILFVDHDITDIEHGGQIAAQIDHAAAPPGKGNQRKIFLFLQFIKYPADSHFRDTPAQGKVAAAGQRIAGAVAEIDHRAKFGALDLAVVVNGMYPEIQYNIHLGAFSHADQFMDCSNREKEKAHILLTWVVVVECGIMLFPSGNAEFNEMASAEAGIGNVILVLEKIQDGQCLVLEPCAEPSRKL